jgi:regulator of sigma E protease
MFDTLRTILSFVIDIAVLIYIHELGHYLAARACGVTVEVFSIGFGPALFSRKAKSGTVWQVSALPLGGYVKMQGWGEDDETDGPPAPGSFGAASLGAKAVIVAAGPLANLALAVVLFAGLFMTAGQMVTQPVLSEVLPNSPAASAHLLSGDRVLKIGVTPINNFRALQDIVTANPDRVLDFTIQRHGTELTLPVQVGETAGGAGEVGHLGVVGSESQFQRYAPGPAVVEAFAETGRQINGWGQGILTLILQHHGFQDLAGPLGIAQVTGQAASLGIASIIGLLAMLSINLGLVNLIPIPVLDGGHLLFYGFEAVLRRPLSVNARETGIRFGLLVIVSLMLVTTFNDLNRLGAVAWITHLL